MEKSIFAKLPDEVINHILLYDEHFIWRENKLISIDLFSKTDMRYLLLQKIPRKYKMGENWSVILMNEISKKRFVLGYRMIVNKWEYFFYTFSFDPIMCHMRDNPDTSIYYYI